MSLAGHCADCGLTTVPAPPRTDPATILARLPRALFNTTPATEASVPALLAGDVIQDDTVFGPLGSNDATPQFELARILAGEKDDWLGALQQAQIDQLGLGTLRLIDDGVHGLEPHAIGADLDRVGGQFAIGRPVGFTDCCYWRLVQLLLFTRGGRGRGWLLGEIAELYTGERPAIREELCKLTLTWPPLDATQAAYLNRDAYLNRETFISSEDAAPVSPYDAVAAGGVEGLPGEDLSALPVPLASRPAPPDDASTYLEPVPTRIGSGLTLPQALNRVKLAGIAIVLVNEPISGKAGCAGATLRGVATGRGRIG